MDIGNYKLGDFVGVYSGFRDIICCFIVGVNKKEKTLSVIELFTENDEVKVIKNWVNLDMEMQEKLTLKIEKDKNMKKHLNILRKIKIENIFDNE